MHGIDIREFLRQNLGIPLVNATEAAPPDMLKLVVREGKRLALIQDGLVVAAIVPTWDLELLEITDHGISVVT